VDEHLMELALEVSASNRGGGSSRSTPFPEQVSRLDCPRRIAARDRRLGHQPPIDDAVMGRPLHLGNLPFTK